MNRHDRGTGTVLTIALVLGMLALTATVVPLYRGLALRAAVAGAADAAALAAADVAVGIEPGYPCEIAAHVASANESTIASCEVDGLVVTVVATRSVLGIPVTAAATAGPPPGEAD